MIGIGIATATAGVIVGTVSLTGVGAAMTDVVEVISGGNVMLMLIFTAVMSLILGMGLPTTANYIVVSSVMAPVIVELGTQNGLLVPLIAVHMFVFYFGIMADVTPPVGLASFAAAAISGGDPLKTGFVAFFYSMRTALLPFLFIFNTIGVPCTDARHLCFTPQWRATGSPGPRLPASTSAVKLTPAPSRTRDRSCGGDRRPGE
jgi:TRAP-type uncharacterized transport system fused permease subunit